jgi:transcriptional regulator with XRE-family HTH domain
VTEVVASPVAARIRAAQREAGLTNEQLAREIGVGARLVSKWRAGTVIPSMPNLTKLSHRLNKPLDWFFREDEAAA